MPHDLSLVLPTFIIIGAAKSGTTSLWQYLRSHPDVYMAENKEPAFFVAEREWARGTDWYKSHFAATNGAKAVGEASTAYTMFPEYAGVAARMASVVPDARLIYLMRNPIDAVRSAYSYSLHLGTETRSLREAVLRDARYINWCRYALQVEQYLRHFPLPQLLLLTSERLRDEPAETISTISQFIGVDPQWQPPQNLRHNASDDRRAPRTGWRLLGDVVVRSELVGRHVPGWVGRLGESSITTRAITKDETAIDDDLRGRITDLLRADLERLREWLGPSFDAWGLLD